MTCIIGLVNEDKRIYLGGDSATLSGGISVNMRDCKVFRTKDFLMGFTGVMRGAQLLRYGFVPPEHPENMGIETYLATLFIDALRTTLKDGGNASKNNEYEYASGSFLVGYRSRLFEIDSAYGFLEPEHGYHCIGCGGEVALGAMHATRHMSLIPQKRIELALEAAEAFCEGVRSPFHVLTLKEQA